jgi:histidine triad (HIT) family protein
MRYTPEENPTIFGKILRKEIPSKFLYEDDFVVAFNDIAPKADTHVLIIPKQHIESLQDVSEADTALMGHMLVAANKIADQLGVRNSGYRLITNAGEGAGQEVPHLHFHLLAGSPKLPGF